MAFRAQGKSHFEIKKVTGKSPTDQISPSVQIHFTGNSHWITSFQFEGGSNVYLLDSLYSSQELPMCVKLQLAQIYGKGKDRLDSNPSC